MHDRNPVIRSARRLPSGRAVLGGLLVTLAVLAVLAASRLGDDATYRDVVVARTDLAPGSVVGPDDVAQIRIRLDAAATFVVSNPEDVYGSVLLGPVSRLEFIQESNVARLSGGDLGQPLAEVSLAIEPERAPARLLPGELVSILATFDDASGSATRVVADRVPVLSYITDGVDFSNEAVLRVGVADGGIAVQLVDAAQTAELTVVGVTGAPDVALRAIPTP